MIPDRLRRSLGLLIAPGAALVAFGQTALWDEPMKAMIAADCGRRMIVGVHDLDYFSRIRGALPGDEWQILARNDGALRDVWIAAGELSALFGSEVLATRRALALAGVRLDKVRPKSSGPTSRDRLTMAWGWRGIVCNTPEPPVICDVSAAEVSPALLELLKWGFRQTLRTVANAESRRQVRRTGKLLAGLIQEFVAGNPSASLTELYQHLLSKLYEMLIGRVPQNVEISSTRRLLTFSRRTADLPRFRLVGCFLNPRTAPASRAAYEAAVTGSAMSRLVELGDHALPFDVYVPGRGRGTLHVGSDAIWIATQPEIRVPVKKPVHTVKDLARVLEKALGSEIALVGKAVALIAMLSREFVMVLNESGSAYVPQTRQMLQAMRAAGVKVDAHPILRIRLKTWDSISAGGLEFRLPDHLVQAFGRSTITAREFGRTWHRAVQGRRQLLHRLSQIASPCELVRYLGHEKHAAWFQRLERCMKANQTLLDVQRRVDSLRHRVLELRSALDEVTLEIKDLERRRGCLNRNKLRPLKRRIEALPQSGAQRKHDRHRHEHERVAKEGEALLMALEAKQAERRRLRESRRRLLDKLRKVERGTRATSARRTYGAVVRDAEKARARLARNAILAAEGLTCTDLRPSAWWMPAVDPSGKWFAKIAKTARFRLESLLDEGR